MSNRDTNIVRYMVGSMVGGFIMFILCMHITLMSLPTKTSVAHSAMFAYRLGCYEISKSEKCEAMSKKYEQDLLAFLNGALKDE